MRRTAADGASRRTSMRPADIDEFLATQRTFALEILFNQASITVSRRFSTAC